MPVENFLRYKGLCYDVGTKLRFYARIHQINIGVKEGVIEKFINGTVYIKTDDGFTYSYSTVPCHSIFDYIIEIIKPIYYEEEPKQLSKNNKNYPSEDSVFIGWIWYIIIMVVGTVFNERLLVWVFATAFFFLWKNGLMSNKD